MLFTDLFNCKKYSWSLTRTRLIVCSISLPGSKSIREAFKIKRMYQKDGKVQKGGGEGSELQIQKSKIQNLEFLIIVLVIKFPVGEGLFMDFFYLWGYSFFLMLP